MPYLYSWISARVVVVCWFLFSTRLTETQHNGTSTQLLPLSFSENTGFLNAVLSGFKLLLFFSFFFFTHLWFCCLVKGSSCFAPLFNSLYIMYMSHYFHWVVTGYIRSITFSADLHWPQISKGPVWSGLCWSSAFISRVLGYKPFQVKA